MVFEGEKTELQISNNLKKYFLDDIEEEIVYGFHCSDIYSLCNKLKNDEDLELFTLLKKKLEPKNTDLQNIEKGQVSQIYLFFDYDEQSSSANDDELKNILELFDNETENGKLYISYPMVEAIKHLKENVDFRTMTAISEGKYKEIVSNNCNNGLIDLRKLSQENWNLIINEHCKKANYIVHNNFTFPNEIIKQISIWQKQKQKYINTKNEVSVLSAFPLFLLDYYGAENLQNKIL